MTDNHITAMLIMIVVFQLFLHLRGIRDRESREAIEREAARRAIDSWKYGDSERIAHYTETRGGKKK